MSKCIAYIGTYSKGENGGIFRVEIDDQTGDLAVPVSYTHLTLPTILLV